MPNLHQSRHCPVCQRVFVPAAPNQLYDTLRCQKKAERARRAKKNDIAFNASAVAERQLDDELARIQAEAESDPIQAAIDRAAASVKSGGETP